MIKAMHISMHVCTVKHVCPSLATFTFPQNGSELRDNKYLSCFMKIGVLKILLP